MRVRSLPRWRLAVLGTAGALLAALAVPANAAQGADVAAQARGTGPLSLAAGAYFGGLINPDRTTPSSTPAEVTALEGKIGRKLDIVNHFYTYPQFVGTQGEVQDVAGGRIPMVTWGATSTTSINNGSQDTFITAQANRLKNLGGPVILRYYHEPEGAYRSNIIGSPAAYISAWKRARMLFTNAGATNVIWMWTTTAFSFRIIPNPPPQAFYPGHDQVDWIAADGYNFAPNKPGSTWLSFEQVFRKWYTWAATMPKPLMVAEYGVMEDPAIPMRKATWYNDMRNTVKTGMPLIQGVVAWSTVNVKEGATFNWNVDSTQNSLNAWKAMGDDPYFRPTRPLFP